jgi:hypothetical protein
VCEEGKGSTFLFFFFRWISRSLTRRSIFIVGGHWQTVTPSAGPSSKGCMHCRCAPHWHCSLCSQALSHLSPTFLLQRRLLEARSEVTVKEAAIAEKEEAYAHLRGRLARLPDPSAGDALVSYSATLKSKTKQLRALESELVRTNRRRTHIICSPNPLPVSLFSTLGSIPCPS